MKEREGESPPYFQYDQLIGEAPVQGEERHLRLRLHTQEERYHERHELVPLRYTSGTRTYVHARPYILVPDIRLTVGLSPEPGVAGEVGRVIASDWEGMRHLDIGNAQAWAYPADRTLILWECFLEDRYQSGDDPNQDPAHVAVWRGFEQQLMSKLRPFERIVTTWEDIYPRGAWQAFLEEQGYQQLNRAAFVKLVGGDQ